MLAPLFLLALTGPLRPADTSPEISKGAALVRGCQAELRLMALPSFEGVTQGDLIQGAYCVGYLNGFTGGLDPAKAAICTHHDSMGSLVRAYVAYMEQNPHLLEEDKRVGLFLALQNAYPCPGTR
jgi:hypothetical protein